MSKLAHCRCGRRFTPPRGAPEGVPLCPDCREPSAELKAQAEATRRAIRAARLSGEPVVRPGPAVKECGMVGEDGNACRNKVRGGGPCWMHRKG